MSEGTKSLVFLNQLSITDDDLLELFSLPFSASGTRRLCLHKSDESALHVMVVQSSLESIFPRHCHNDSDEFTTVIQGGLEIDVWHEGLQRPSRLLTLGRAAGGGICTLVPKGVFHSSRVLSEDTVYLEVKLGPFRRSEMRFSPDLC